jgi:hypothetical protein
MLLYSFLLGSLDYGLYASLLVGISSLTSSQLEVKFFSSLVDSNQEISFAEVYIVSAVAIIAGLVVSLAVNRKLIYRIAHVLKVSEKYGDLNVFGYIMNSPASEWILVRDIERDLMYEGWIQAFSDGDEEHDELLLRDVIVYKNSTAAELFRSAALYVSRQKGALLIEISGIPFTEGIRRESN